MNTGETRLGQSQNGRHWIKYGLIFLAIAALFLALIAYQVHTSYKTAKAATITDARNLAQVLESKLYRDLLDAQEAVNMMVAEIEPDAMRPANAPRYRPQIVRWLQSHIQTVATASALRFFDAKGDRLYSSTAGEPDFNIGDRKYFQQLRADPSIPIIFSEVVLGRLTGRPIMFVAKPVRNNKGTFLGIALYALELLAMREQFRSIELGQEGAIALHRLDNGAAVVRIPGPPMKIDNQPAPDMPTRQAILKHGPVGTLEIKSTVDGIRRIYGYRALGDLPFFISVGIAENEYLSAWRTSAAISLIASLLFLATLAVVFFRLSSAKLRQEGIMGEMQTILRNALVGIVHLRQRRIVSCNRRLEEIFGYEHGELIGATTERLYDTHESFVGVGERAYADLGRNNNYSEELLLRKKDGSLFWGALTGCAIDPAHPQEGSIWIYADISARRQAELDLLESRQHLEDLVRQRTAELTEALEAAQLADRTKDEFLANISHELRTPLNAVIGLSALARNLTADPKLHDYLDKIATSGKHLARIINDLLDLSKIAAGHMEFEAISFSLRKLSQNSTVMTHKAAEKGLTLVQSIDDDVPDVLIGDPLRLEQIVFNLLSNAIKFTPAGRVEIRIGLHKREESRVCLNIVVTDTGIGMSQADLERLFKPFSQADASMSRKYGGTGLGLAISRRLAEMMGGDISVESLAGKGTTFRVKVWFGLGEAVDLPQSGPPAEMETLPLRWSGAKVLVVEDQPMNREIVDELLRTAGIIARMACNGQEALDILAESGPAGFDLILMDIQMPVMDGLTATRAIRSQAAYAQLPIVAMSAHTMKHEIEIGTAAGINDHIGKPFDAAGFYRILKKWLPHSRQETQSSPPSPAENQEAGMRGIDTQAGLALFAGNQARYQYWLTDFVAQAPGYVPQIRQFLSSGQHQQARQSAHTCKGRVGMLGMKDLHTIVAALEAALKQGQPAEELLERMERLVTLTCHEIRTALDLAEPANVVATTSDGVPSRSLPQQGPAPGATAGAGRGQENGNKLILLIDDDPAVLETLNQCLRPYYQTRCATSGKQGLDMMRLKPLPSLILLDVELPDMTGYEICAALKQNELTAAIPVIFLSSHSDVGDITQGLELGAVDYVAKPVAPPILLARVRTQLRLRETRDLLRDQNAHLEFQVSKRTRDLEARTLELQNSQELTIFALGSIAETRDNETGNHIHRTSTYVEILARRLSAQPSYRDRVHAAQPDWELIWKSAPLHDIGKVGIPDHILLKPGRLTAAEFEVMKRHTVLGRDAIRAAEVRVNTSGSFLRMASEIAYSHHERWDGAGYPEGLQGETIPLAARLMAVADVYDALISVRVYKPKLGHTEAIEIIRAGRGSQFDPVLVDCFLEVSDEFHSIAEKFCDALGE